MLICRFLRNRGNRKKYYRLSIIELHHVLECSIMDEEYEIAAMVRDELKRRTGL
jgi:protein-arginine kinase activator protein McsA